MAENQRGERTARSTSTELRSRALQRVAQLLRRQTFGRAGSMDREDRKKPESQVWGGVRESSRLRQLRNMGAVSVSCLSWVELSGLNTDQRAEDGIVWLAIHQTDRDSTQRDPNLRSSSAEEAEYTVSDQGKRHEDRESTAGPGK